METSGTAGSSSVIGYYGTLDLEEDGQLSLNAASK